MGSRPSDTEMQRRIAELLRTPKAGRAVAGHLSRRTEAWAQRAAIGDLRARRPDAMQGADDAGRDPVAAGAGEERQMRMN